MTSIKIKKQLSPLSRVLSDQTLNATKKKNLSSTQRKLKDTNSTRLTLTLQDSNLLHNINLQIPSLNSPDRSMTKLNPNNKRAACIKGFSSKMPLVSPKTCRKKKVCKESTKPKDSIEETERFEKTVNFSQVKELEERLKKAIEVNKSLKKDVQIRANDEAVSELMKSFKSRLYKLLYE